MFLYLLLYNSFAIRNSVSGTYHAATISRQISMLYPTRQDEDRPLYMLI